MDILAILGDASRAAIGPEAAIYALAAIGLNMHFGYTGLLNFGQVGFMLVGADGVAVAVTTFSAPWTPAPPNGRRPSRAASPSTQARRRD